MTSPEEFFAEHPDALRVYETVRAEVERLGPVEVRVTRSQVAFRRRRGFAYLWLPGQWLRNPSAEVVLSLALDHRVPSTRFKQVVRPSPHTWMHHLEVRAVSDIDDKVSAWLADAYRGAG
ncbi:MAG TPA: DUF5655 domain-containing protein [Jiangellales bacterium]|nr:DUF5655 domain-containing protein [Jiangellales bacterium]